jgi:hypothetical protein
MDVMRATETDSLSCDEHACDWDTRGDGALLHPGAASPAPGQFDDESDGDAASQSDEEEAPPDAEHWEAALAAEAALQPDAGYPGRLQPVVDAAARALTVDWLLAVRQGGVARGGRGAHAAGRA